MDGITAKHRIIRQLNDAATLIENHNPYLIVGFDGHCLVSFVPFFHLFHKYRDDLDVLWIDSHFHFLGALNWIPSNTLENYS